MNGCERGRCRRPKVFELITTLVVAVLFVCGSVELRPGEKPSPGGVLKATSAISTADHRTQSEFIASLSSDTANRPRPESPTQYYESKPTKLETERDGEDKDDEVPREFGIVGATQHGDPELSARVAIALRHQTPLRDFWVHRSRLARGPPTSIV